MPSTSTPTTPQTLLEAVNQLLKPIRVSSVMSLEAADTNQDASDAKQALDAVSREVQLKGWEFNTEFNYVIDPSETGEITIPNNCLEVRIARDSEGTRLVQRGRRLYDNQRSTYAIGSSVTVEMVIALPFEDLPEPFKRWVTAEAARRFCIPKLPSGAVFQYTEEYLMAAMQAAQESDLRTLDGDLATTSPHFAKMRRR